MPFWETNFYLAKFVTNKHARLVEAKHLTQEEPVLLAGKVMFLFSMKTLQ